MHCAVKTTYSSSMAVECSANYHFLASHISVSSES